MEDRLDALRPRLREHVGLGGIHRGVEDTPGDTHVLRILRMRVGQRVAAHQERRRLVGDVRAHAGLDVVVLHLERLDAEDDVEVGVQRRRGVAQVVQEARDALARGLGDLLVAAPLADHVGPAIAADVERRGVLEARAAVVGPDREVRKVGHAPQQPLQGLAEVAARDRVILREGVARQPGAERMVDARTAERGILLEEPLGEGARLEHAHAGP